MYRTYRHRSFREAQSNLERLHLAVTLQFPMLVYFYLESLLEQGYDIHQFLNICFQNSQIFERPNLFFSLLHNIHEIMSSMCHTGQMSDVILPYRRYNNRHESSL
jgi:hypothetical protein